VHFLWRWLRVLVLRVLRWRARLTTRHRSSAAADDWATTKVTAPPEMWALIAEHSGPVGAWRLTGVCRTAREGAKTVLRALPGMVMCGGRIDTGVYTTEVWRLNLGELQWERMPSLIGKRAGHACCTVRGGVVVIGGGIDVKQVELAAEDAPLTASVEISGYDAESKAQNVFKTLPLLSCGSLTGAAAVVIEENESSQGQVLLIGAPNEPDETNSAVYKVDLATGVCTPQASLLSRGQICTAARVPDGRIVCVGGITAEVLEPPEQGSLTLEASWRWRELPRMSVSRNYCSGCALRDGRFAVFGGMNAGGTLASCEVLTMGEDERWKPLPPMPQPRWGFACVSIGGCVIVAGGLPNWLSGGVDVYEEESGRWMTLPCNPPHARRVIYMGSALL
jgi:hypothetical protein